MHAGYTGFIKHSKDTFAKTYGETTRQLREAPSELTFETDIGRPFGCPTTHGIQAMKACTHTEARHTGHESVHPHRGTAYRP